MAPKISDTSVLSRLQRELVKTDLMNCPLCSRIFKEPIVLNECSHRFCLKCIQEHKRLRGQKCPSCERAFNEFSVDKAFASVIRLTELSRQAEKPCASQEFNGHLNTVNTDELINLVLWPSACVYDLPLPSYIKHPRYIQVPENTTVAHLIEYLYLRLEVEGNGQDSRNQYKIELTHVLKERENVTRRYLPIKARFSHRSGNDLNQEPEEFPRNNIMFTMKYPFESLPSDLTAQQLVDDYWIDMSRPFKIIFRFVNLN